MATTLTPELSDLASTTWRRVAKKTEIAVILLRGPKQPLNLNVSFEKYQ
jgi:hypothetical protein